MLDWTNNPLSALYFSVIEYPERVGRLYALRSEKKASKLMRQGSPLILKKPVKFYPNVVSPRIRAQEGVFIVCVDLEHPLDNPLRAEWEIEHFDIASESKLSIRYELFRLGIHAATLFPDIDGLARRIAWQHTVSPTANGG